MNESLFKPSQFLENSNIYEVNIRQYTPEGTFKAFASHLSRLKDMGVVILWLMPVHPIGEINRKGTLGSYYSIKDHKGVNPEFGTAQDFKELISKVHDAGMKIIIDWVANHTAWDHVWTISNPDFFDRDETGAFKAPYDWDDVVQIDHTSKGEQAAMINAMQYWITDFDIDGFRADLAHLTPLQFWKDARLKLSPFKKNLIWLAETEAPAYHEAFDISYTWKWMHATQKFANKEFTLSDCMQVLHDYKNDFPANALRLFFTSNHDENTWNGTEYEKYGHLAKALAVFSCTYPGVPLVYSGQELPSQKRLQFFEKDIIEWEEDCVLHNFYKSLFALRKRSKGLFTSSDKFLIIEECISKNVLAYHLTKENQVIVFLNLGDQYISEEIALKNIRGKFKDLFSGAISEIKERYIFSGNPGEFTVLEKLQQ